MGTRAFLTVQWFIWHNCSQVSGYLIGGSMVGLVATSSKKAYATCYVTQVCCTEFSKAQIWTREHIANITWVIGKAREFHKYICFCFIVYTIAFNWVGHTKMWKILKEMQISDHLTCRLRNLYSGQEATFRTRHGTQAGSKSGKEYVKAVYCHPAYLTYRQIHHKTCWTGWSTSWNQDHQEKYQ